MPRQIKTVKPFLKTSSALDLHFHGAYGVDFMNTESTDLSALKQLSKKLLTKGVGGICATTLSASRETLLPAVEMLGKWCESRVHQPGTKVIGIHLEGPFLHPDFKGAHPKDAIVPFTFEYWNELWDISRGSLKIVTLAPECLDDETLFKLCKSAQKRNIKLNLGHSKATETEAQKAFQAGFSGITHLWNALYFHHRNAGALGAALHFLDPSLKGRPQKKSFSIELIPDQIHLSTSTLEMSLKLFKEHICFVSDAAPATGCKEGSIHSFGDLKCIYKNGASRIAGTDHLAGGGKLLPEMVKDLLHSTTALYAPHLSSNPLLEHQRKKLIQYTNAMSKSPLKTMGLQKTLNLPEITWYLDKKGNVTL